MRECEEGVLETSSPGAGLSFPGMKSICQNGSFAEKVPSGFALAVGLGSGGSAPTSVLPFPSVLHLFDTNAENWEQTDRKSFICRPSINMLAHVRKVVC